MNCPGKDRWMALLKASGLPEAGSQWHDRLLHAYTEPQRHYHNCRHIAECLGEFDQARHLLQQPFAVELALWFHDAVYDPKASDNEDRSAALAGQFLGEYSAPEPLAGTVVRLILLTKQHEVMPGTDDQVMVDVDLSILGRNEDRFWEFEGQIRNEYAWVPDEVFAMKRAEFLRTFLERDRVYSTNWFRDRFEKQARKNMEAAVRKWSFLLRR